MSTRTEHLDLHIAAYAQSNRTLARFATDGHGAIFLPTSQGLFKRDESSSCLLYTF